LVQDENSSAHLNAPSSPKRRQPGVEAMLANGFIAVVMVARRKSLLPLLVREIGVNPDTSEGFATLS
jgi:hypothetical protein